MLLPPIHLPLPEAFTTSCFEPEHRTIIRCFCSPCAEAVLILKEWHRGSHQPGVGFFLKSCRTKGGRALLLWQLQCCAAGSPLLCDKHLCNGVALSWLCCRSSQCCLPPRSHTWDIPLPVCVGRVGAHPAGCQGPAHPAGTLQLGFTWSTNICAGPAGACLFCSRKEQGRQPALTPPGAVTALSHCSQCSLSHPGEARGATAPAQGWLGGEWCQQQGRKETACTEGRSCQEGGQAHPARNSLEPGYPASEKPDWNGKYA